MANECDITYATPTAIFGYPPVRYGSSVVLGILPPWLLGRKKTMEMANRIASGPWAAVQLARYTIYAGERQSFQENLDLSMLAANLETETIAEGMIAKGVEKREANYTGL